ncbi:RluA family pseudouridine synthase [Rubritalea profundi]|uniref:RluA family pseudouridine synthase n=1 Tax=Rubritalea profundi TaxID=1658618 RepID=UPI00197EE301|nr:pseudouridine synthase [Rubritalea profundi]
MKKTDTEALSMTEALKILYQDEWLVAIDKPAGHLVHPAESPQDDDLVAMKILRDQIGKRVNTIHRIDRPTSGVLLFGLEKQATKKLHKALELHDFDKSYWAVVQGKAPAEQWQCHQPIQKEDGAPVREAHTSFRVLESRKVEALASLEEQCAGHGDILTLIEAIPHSGRFHQIRRHLLHADIPIVGDYRYAGIETCDRIGELLASGTRMLLQAKSLTLDHPITGDKLTITAPLGPNFLRCFPSLAE